MDEFLFEPGSHLAALADAVPMPLFVVDEDVRLLHANAAALAFMDAPLPSFVRDLCGRALECIHERNSAEACGHTPHCSDCEVRRAVEAALECEQATRRPCHLVVQRDEQEQTMTFDITTTPFEYGGDMLVILVFENIAKLSDQRPP